MTLRQAIKYNAKKSLRGNWGRAILILLIMIGVSLLLSILTGAVFGALGYENIEITADLFGTISYVIEEKVEAGPAIVSVLFSFIHLCIIAPLSLGVTDWALELSDGRVRPVSHIFWAFDNAAMYRSVWLEIVIAIKTGIFSALVLAIPVLLIVIGAVSGHGASAAAPILIVLGVLLLVVAVPLIAWFSARFYAARLLLCDRYYYTVRQAIKLSVAVTRGRRWKIIVFDLSFILWMLLCVFVIPILYVAPYYMVASTLFARYLFEDHLLRQKKLDVSDPDRIIIDDVAPADYAAARAEQGFSAAEETAEEEFKVDPVPAEEPAADAEETDIADL